MDAGSLKPTSSESRGPLPTPKLLFCVGCQRAALVIKNSSRALFLSWKSHSLEQRHQSCAFCSTISTHEIFVLLYSRVAYLQLPPMHTRNEFLRFKKSQFRCRMSQFLRRDLQNYLQLGEVNALASPWVCLLAFDSGLQSYVCLTQHRNNALQK